MSINLFIPFFKIRLCLSWNMRETSIYFCLNCAQASNTFITWVLLLPWSVCNFVLGGGDTFIGQRPTLTSSTFSFFSLDVMIYMHLLKYNLYSKFIETKSIVLVVNSFYEVFTFYWLCIKSFDITWYYCLRDLSI